VAVELVRGTFDLLGRAAIPAALLVGLLMFRSELSEKLVGTESLQVGDYGIKFRFPESGGGSVELEALALYWLLDTAKRTDAKGGLNYNSLREVDLAAIESLRASGLLTAVTTDLSEEESRQRFGIRKVMTLTITDKGLNFLKSSKLASIRPEQPKPAASGASP